MIPEFLWHGAEAYGFRGEVWTCARIAQVIEEEFGVRYHFVADSDGAVWLEVLSGYAPDLNPWDEGGWHYLKDVEMRNLVCRDLKELHQEFYLAVGRLRQKSHLVQSFLAQAGLMIGKVRLPLRSDQ